MSKLISRIVCLCAILCLSPTSVWGQINGFHSNPRVFNDFSTSTLVIVNPGTNPDVASINDSNMTGTGFANRHDILASSDGGASNFTFNTGQGFKITTTFTLTDGSNAPRKEAGIRINGGSGTGDVQLIVNSDAGEIVTFGGPFHSFGSNATSNGYTPGTPITLSMEYDPPGLVDPTKGLLTVGVNYPTLGLNQTFSGLFSNIEGGPGNGSTFGVYGQVSPANAADFMNISFANIQASLVPEPASIGMISLGLVSLLARRRAAR